MEVVVGFVVVGLVLLMEVVVNFMGFVTGSCSWIVLQWGW